MSNMKGFSNGNPIFPLSLLEKLSLGGVQNKLIFGFFTVFAVTFFMFQKKLLPINVSKVCSKIFFYPTFPLTILNRLGNFYSKVDDTLYLGCAPMAIMGTPSHIYKLGVRGVVNMCYEYPGPKNSYASLGIKQLHLPSCDHYEVSVEDMRKAVEFIKMHKDKGEKVYVHCKAGHGRAASIALCWMMHENPTAPIKDLNTLLGLKRKVRKTLYQQSQVKVYHEYIKSLGLSSSSE